MSTNIYKYKIILKKIQKLLNKNILFSVKIILQIEFKMFTQI